MSALDDAASTQSLLTSLFEGWSSRSYWDKDGEVWTIGFGAVGPDIGPDTVWSHTQGDSWLKSRIEGNLDDIDKNLSVDLSTNQLAALGDFAYNEGLGGLFNSTLFKVIQVGGSVTKDHFLAYRKAGGRTLPGLVRRRYTEWLVWSGKSVPDASSAGYLWMDSDESQKWLS
jgi:lysozyme